MNKHEFLETVKKQVLYIYDRQNIGYELSEHIDDSARDIMEEEGLSYDEAVDIAIKQMGNPVEIGKQLNKAHHPLLGYLLLAAKIYLLFNVLPMIVIGFVLISDSFKLLFPYTLQNTETIVKIHEKVEMPTHYISIDNVCYKDGKHYLTYRTRKKYNYSRSNFSTELLFILDEEGNHFDDERSLSSSFVGGVGYTRIEMPDDGSLDIRLRDGKIITINLKEHGYE